MDRAKRIKRVANVYVLGRVAATAREPTILRQDLYLASGISCPSLLYSGPRELVGFRALPTTRHADSCSAP